MQSETPPTFIDAVIRACTAGPENSLSNTTFILPSSLAVSAFETRLLRQATHRGWAPHITTLSDWIDKKSRLQPASELALMQHLYQSAQQAGITEEAFHSFYRRGKMLLNDFDLIDAHLVKAEHLFSTLQQYKALGAGYDYLSPTQWAAIYAFWKKFEKRLSVHQENFMKFWRELLSVYQCFRARLQRLGIGYWGMRCRDLYQCLTSNSSGHFSASLRIVGLHDLSPAERGILTRYPSNVPARFYWDVDAHYMQHPHAEAGTHLRSYLHADTTNHHFVWAPQAHRAEISVISTSSATAQVYAMATALRALQREERDAFCPSQVGIFLADDTLLPLLHYTLSAQGHATALHIPCSMGSTVAYQLIEALAAWCGACSENAADTDAVRSVMQHPYLKTCLAKVFESSMSHRPKESMTIERLRQMGPLGSIVSEVPGHPAQFPDYVERVFQCVSSQSSSLSEIERSILERVSDRLKRVCTAHPFADFKPLLQLLPALFAPYKLPYSLPEEPALHVLSVESSLALDFKFLFFLSMEEGSFPYSFQEGSHIPYSLRKGYELPTAEQHTAQRCAYPFYRLLQRARRATLFYSAVGKGVGEMSRYARQLMFEWPGRVTHRSVAQRHPKMVVRPISVDKRSPAVWSALQKLIAAPQVSLSPSALNLYLDCRLKFYFKYIARFEGQVCAKDAQSALLGKALHVAMERLYRPLVGSHPVSSEILATVGTQVPVEADESIRRVLAQSNYKDKSSPLKSAVHAVLVDAMHQIVCLDRRYAPFALMGVEMGREEPLQAALTLQQGRDIMLRGVIDRVDCKLGTMRVLDYKSGTIQKNIPHIAAVFERENPVRNANALQALFYAWLLTKQPSTASVLSVRPGIISTREVFQPNFDPHLYLREPNQKRHLPLQCIRPYGSEFELHLKTTLEDLLDPQQPFDQTTVTARCVHCPYKTLCQRG